MKEKKMTQVEKAIALLQSNISGLTAGQLKQRLNTSDSGVRAVISRVRREGFAVYHNEGKLDSRGRQLASTYRIGTPSRAMVKAYYEMVGA